MNTGRRAAVAVLLLAAAGGVSAQQFHLYLKCSGDVQVAGGARPAHLDLALRDNNMTALIQRSNVLPVGERLRYQASPAHYSMTAHAPARHTAVYVDWIRGEVFAWQPDLTKLQTVRLSIDRQTAVLEGELLDGKAELLGRLRMHCEPKTHEDIAKPRF